MEGAKVLTRVLPVDLSSNYVWSYVQSFNLYMGTVQ
jgi:hypothetical protein